MSDRRYCAASPPQRQVAQRAICIPKQRRTFLYLAKQPSLGRLPFQSPADQMVFLSPLSSSLSPRLWAVGPSRPSLVRGLRPRNAPSPTTSLADRVSIFVTGAHSKVLRQTPSRQPHQIPVWAPRVVALALAQHRRPHMPQPAATHRRGTPCGCPGTHAQSGPRLQAARVMSKTRWGTPRACPGPPSPHMPQPAATHRRGTPCGCPHGLTA